MALSDRMKTIIRECGLNQKEFARSIDVTDSFISKLLKNESGLSNSTAKLIEKLYGYSKDWILNGVEPKISNNDDKTLSPLQKKIISDVELMNHAELKTIYAFIESLKVYQKEETVASV
jgi:transcriptional regulator with XRE-family HTH domain